MKLSRTCVAAHHRWGMSRHAAASQSAINAGNDSVLITSGWPCSATKPRLMPSERWKSASCTGLAGCSWRLAAAGGCAPARWPCVPWSPVRGAGARRVAGWPRCSASTTGSPAPAPSPKGAGPRQKTSRAPTRHAARAWQKTALLCVFVPAGQTGTRIWEGVACAVSVRMCTDAAHMRPRESTERLSRPCGVYDGSIHRHPTRTDETT